MKPARAPGAAVPARVPAASREIGGSVAGRAELAAYERFDLPAIPAQPWKNGAGVTRQIAAMPADAGMADFEWRISVAEVESDAPFSAFPGVDRCILLLRGAGMRLKSAGGEVDHLLDTALEPFRFPGDLPLQAGLIGGSCSDFNVMTRRGAWRCDVAVHAKAFDLSGADAWALLCVEGEWEVPGVAGQIGPMQGVVNRAHGQGQLHVQPARAGRIVVVGLCHDRSDDP